MDIHICDVINQNGSELANTVFKIQLNKADSFLLFVQSVNCLGGKIRSSTLSSQILMMLYQKALTGEFVGAVFQLQMCCFIGHCL